MRLLLDSHIPAALVGALHERGVEALHLREWRSSVLLHAPDDQILAWAHVDRLVLLTADQRTVPDLLRAWGAEGRSHGGVILVSGPQAGIGALVRGLDQLLSEMGDSDWTDRVVYLPLD